ncbi:F-box domain-containing protein [Caenorhabditis elegans]|uniref:F-box domain-containing protein n=1 Tax=Caenorhabditis elegans TaxID=6239 RepID=O45769_CAEEL|nr:F-box domain-containing protein [Caenorhabditis elegans]CAB07663.2 F-box domain-containing protein [Caenorhabditis elegans]|eukprot:NP_507028.2 Uncharacterized protein CELE_T10C6.7 [Caenorhabditis elegans]
MDALNWLFCNLFKRRQKQPKFKRLLQLPPPAFANILKILGAVKIFQLSQLSNRMCMLIQAANITFDHIVIKLSENSNSIEFRINEKQLLIFYFNAKAEDCTRKLKFERQKILAFLDNHTEFKCHTTNVMSSVAACVQYFSKLFVCRCKLVSFKVYPQYQLYPQTLRVFLEMEFFKNHLVLKLHGELRTIYENELQLLPKKNVLHGIVIDLNSVNFKEEKIFSLPHVCITKCDWITSSVIMDMRITGNLTRLTLMNIKFKEEDVTKIINHWRNGNWDNLKFIEIWNKVQLNSDFLKGGLTFMTRDTERRDQFHIPTAQ